MSSTSSERLMYVQFMSCVYGGSNQKCDGRRDGWIYRRFSSLPSLAKFLEHFSQCFPSKFLALLIRIISEVYAVSSVDKTSGIGLAAAFADRSNLVSAR